MPVGYPSRGGRTARFRLSPSGTRPVARVSLVLRRDSRRPSGNEVLDRPPQVVRPGRGRVGEGAVIDQVQRMEWVVEPVEEGEAVGEDDRSQVAQVLIDVGAVVTHVPDVFAIVGPWVDQSL